LTPLVDKILVRDYVRDRVGSEHLIELLWHGKDPESIPFEALPASYVIKTNHGSGGHAFVRGQPDRAQLTARFQAALRDNYYWRSREFQYFNIVPQVLVEALIDDGVAGGPLDYRCWCFHSQVRLIQVDNHAYSRLEFYDREWNPLALRHRLDGGERTRSARPDNLSELLSARIMGRGDRKLVVTEKMPPRAHRAAPLV
jgi:TupA-like ATPgrasp